MGDPEDAQSTVIKRESQAYPFWNTFNIEQRTSKYESTL
jgi:hypothetical protein